MKIIKGKHLADFTTFRIGGDARFFCSIESKEDLREAVNFAKEKSLPVFILGGGSNILVSDKGFDGLVVKMEKKGIEELESGVNQEIEAAFGARQTPQRRIFQQAIQQNRPLGANIRAAETLGSRSLNDKDIFIRAGAGENWDDFVAWTVSNGYGGLENLSLIPGTVGAASVQNIGAYGVEVGGFIESVEVFDIKENAFKNLSRKECNFSYRDSMFKHENGRYVITSVLFKLNKNTTPDISYKDLVELFKNKQKPSVPQVRAAVIAIRTAKLPDLSKVGTAGSFFKNPIISKEKYAELKERYPELPSFAESAKGGDGRVKIPLAWIIDKICGLKGKKYGKAGIHETQSLVIVNHGGATYEDVEKVAREVEKSVKEKTGIEIEREVIMV
jgi:UDP-N-acetylmuramate dehydrogenase